MSDTASLEFSRELYHLSKWQGTQNVYWFKQEPTMFDADEWVVSARANVHQDHIPAYDAGYLLRKLPQRVNDVPLYLKAAYSTDNFGWRAKLDTHEVVADTPEDCLAKLCIVLFKEGILPISGRDL